MKTLKGKSVFSGIAIGKMMILRKKNTQPELIKIQEPEKEIRRVKRAQKEALSQLSALYDQALAKVGEGEAAIFEVHQMMLLDGSFLDSIYDRIRREKVKGEYAAAAEGKALSEKFSAMEDSYMRARAADIQDITDRLIRILCGEKEPSFETKEPVIVTAEDLTPSETLQLDKSKVMAFVTKKGSSNSHSAILARTMNIPALIGVSFEEDMDGKMAVVDGEKGLLLLEPDEDTLKAYQQRQDQEKRRRALLKEQKGLPTCTAQGKRIRLYANIGSTEDVKEVLENDGEGIGLFRSEFLYLEKKDYPTEEELFDAYRQAAEEMAGKKVIIRTLDIGADKQIPYFHMEHEENPAMGYRAIRVCLDRQDIFRTQLRAILRAGRYGDVAVMYPMIISLDEVRKIKAIFEEVKEELRRQQTPFDEHMEQGIMIETPAAAVISDLLAKEVDFFSIGTNDLTQYTLAMDRQNVNLENIYDPHHEAILRLIKATVENAHRAGIWAGICGELGSDLSLIRQFIKMGVDELSVSPSMILPVRKAVRELDL